MVAIIQLGELEFEPHEVPIAPIKRTRSLNFVEQEQLEGKPALLLKSMTPIRRSQLN